jgi:hypothetical protein
MGTRMLRNISITSVVRKAGGATVVPSAFAVSGAGKGLVDLDSGGWRVGLTCGVDAV